MKNPQHNPWVRSLDMPPVFLQVELGNPRQQCRFFGICHVERIALQDILQFRPQNDKTALALVYWEVERLPWLFPYSGMTPLAATRFFGGDFFLVESDFFCRLAGTATGLEAIDVVIQAGQYPIERQINGVAVCFKK